MEGLSAEEIHGDLNQAQPSGPLSAEEPANGTQLTQQERMKSLIVEEIDGQKDFIIY